MASHFLPIPSLGGKYEINAKGTLRRVEDKHKISPVFSVSTIDGKRTSRTRDSLLFEVFGIPNFRNRMPVECYCTKDAKCYHFQTLRDCAKFLVPRLFYSQKYIEQQLYSRKPEINGWKITYK